MTLQQLEYIVALSRLGHFARAAEYCDVTQPTLSAMIQKLEDELGVKLFDRRQQPIQPTQAGREVVEQAGKVLRQARRLKMIVEEERKSLAGTFRLGVLPTIAPYLMPGFLPQLLHEHPEMDVRITEMKTQDMKEALRHGDLDAGLLARVEGLDDMDCHTLYYEQFWAYVSKGSTLHAADTIKSADLRDQTLWLLDEGHCFRSQLVKFCQLNAAARSKRTYNLGSMETFMRMVESGQGITFVPQLALRQLHDEQRQLARPFAPPVPVREIVLMTEKDYVRTTLLHTLTEAIRRSVPQDMLSLHKGWQRVL